MARVIPESCCPFWSARCRPLRGLLAGFPPAPTPLPPPPKGAPGVRGACSPGLRPLRLAPHSPRCGVGLTRGAAAGSPRGLFPAFGVARWGRFAPPSRYAPSPDCAGLRPDPFGSGRPARVAARVPRSAAAAPPPVLLSPLRGCGRLGGRPRRSGGLGFFLFWVVLRAPADFAPRRLRVSPSVFRGVSLRSAAPPPLPLRGCLHPPPPPSPLLGSRLPPFWRFARSARLRRSPVAGWGVARHSAGWSPPFPPSSSPGLRARCLRAAGCLSLCSARGYCAYSSNPSGRTTRMTCWLSSCAVSRSRMSFSADEVCFAAWGVKSSADIFSRCPDNLSSSIFAVLSKSSITYPLDIFKHLC